MGFWVMGFGLQTAGTPRLVVVVCRSDPARLTQPEPSSPERLKPVARSPKPEQAAVFTSPLQIHHRLDVGVEDGRG